MAIIDRGPITASANRQTKLQNFVVAYISKFCIAGHTSDTTRTQPAYCCTWTTEVMQLHIT